MKARWIALMALSACGAPERPVEETKPVPRLDGLWEGVLRFGPDVRGVLAIERRPGGWRAEIAGHSAPVRVTGNAVAFELGDQLGSFEGTLAGDRITGHWAQPGGVKTGGLRFASPVTLVGQGRWSGEVVPLDDRMTMRLVIRQGGARAFLRNPERNAGVFAEVSRVERDGAADQ